MGMPDVNIIVRKWLIDPTLPVRQALGSDRVWGGVLPEKFDPAAGLGIVISTRGGTAFAEIPLIKPSVQVRVWAGINKFADARAMYLKVFDQIHGKNEVDFGSDGHVTSCLEESQGQDVVDPESGWATVIAFFRVTARSN